MENSHQVDNLKPLFRCKTISLEGILREAQAHLKHILLSYKIVFYDIGMS